MKRYWIPAIALALFLAVQLFTPPTVTIYALASRDVEFVFSIKEFNTRNPVARAVLTLHAEPYGINSAEKRSDISDSSGTIKVFCKNMMVEDICRKGKPTVTSIGIPWSMYELKAEGYHFLEYMPFDKVNRQNKGYDPRRQCEVVEIQIIAYPN